VRAPPARGVWTAMAEPSMGDEGVHRAAPQGAGVAR
jgi:hypothetical protein